MKKDNKDLYNKIMEQVAKQVKQSLNEVDDIEPKKQEIVGEVYLVRCDGMNKSVLDKLSSKLPAFDNYGAGSVRITCKTHEEVVKVIALLVNANVLDVDNSLGQAPRIAIQKVNKISVNDSVNEAKEDTERIRIARQYMDPKKFWTPKQPAKLDIILKINNGEMERTPEAIRAALDATGLWKDTPEKRIQMDVNLIMRKTGEKITREEPMEGDFTTDFIYSKDNYEPGEFSDGMAAAENHVKWLVNHKMNVKIEEGRYSYKLHIHYNTKQQFNELVQWMAWHCGYTDAVNQPCPREDKQYFIDMIKSGKKTTW